MRQESRPSDSVLFSLGELRSIERERAERAREAWRQAEAAREAEARAREAAEQEARRRADEERREQEAARNRERARIEQEASQAALKLKHAEEQVRLEKELARQRQEVALRELQRAARTPLWIGGAVIVLLVTLFVIWGVREHRRHRAEAKDAAGAIAKLEEEIRNMARPAVRPSPRLVAKRTAPPRSSLSEPAPPAAKPPKKASKKSTKKKGPRATRPPRHTTPLLNVDRCKGSPDPLCNLPRRARRAP